jgi:hypothetical protein
MVQTNKGGTTAFRPFYRGWEAFFILKGGMKTTDDWWWFYIFRNIKRWRDFNE